MSMITIGLPQHADLAVPPIKPGKPSGQNIKQIMAGYSKYVPTWARAVNVEYRAGASGPSVSLIAEGGTIYTQGDPRWPVFLMSAQGAKIVTAPTDTALTAARWAFSAGPLLLRDGNVTDIPAEIRACGFTGLAEGAKVERAGVGIRADGTLVHIADTAMTLKGLQDALWAQGCRDALNLDGGGSVCVLDGAGKVLLGQAVRQVCCALVFREIIEDKPPSPHPSAWQGKLRVYLSPSQQPNNVGVGDYGTEQWRMYQLAYILAARLAQFPNVEVAVARPNMSMAQVCDESDAWGAHVHICLHSNASVKHDAVGCEVFYAPRSVVGKRLAERVYKSLARLNPNGGRRCEPTGFYELRETNAWASYIECGFHDVAQEAAWIVRRMAAIAEAVADAVEDEFMEV